MALTVVVLLPLGAIIMRVGGGIWVHAALQLLSYALLITGLGLGVHLAQMLDELYKSPGKTHTIFGTVIIGLFLIQPFLGLLQHLHYRRSLDRSAYGYAHIWYGRVLMILAVVNGGLGLQLADNSTGGTIAYGVVAGIVGVVYIGTIFLERLGGRIGKRKESLQSVGTAGSEPNVTPQPTKTENVEGL